MRRVVITGIGIKSGCGGRTLTWEAVKNGINTAGEFIRGGVKYFGVQIKNDCGLTLQNIFENALTEAAADARLDNACLKSKKLLSTISVSKPDFTTYSDTKNFEAIFNSYSASKALESLGLEMEQLFYSAACATGLYSIINAYKAVANSAADVAFAGAGEMPFNELYYNGFKNMNVTADSIMRPFAKSRNGFIMGEGASVVVLELLSNALKRNAPIYAEIAGGESAFDTGALFKFNEDGSSLAELIKKLKLNAAIDSAKGVYIHSHGTATGSNDIAETNSIKSAFGRAAYELKVSSTKPVTGHLLGGSGGIGACIAAMAIKEQFLPPTINLDEPGAGCDLDYVANKGYNWKFDSAITLSMGFGGHIGALALRKYNELDRG